MRLDILCSTYAPIVATARPLAPPPRCCSAPCPGSSGSPTNTGGTRTAPLVATAGDQPALSSAGRGQAEDAWHTHVKDGG